MEQEPYRSLLISCQLFYHQTVFIVSQKLLFLTNNIATKTNIKIATNIIQLTFQVFINIKQFEWKNIHFRLHCLNSFINSKAWCQLFWHDVYSPFLLFKPLQSSSCIVCITGSYSLIYYSHMSKLYPTVTTIYNVHAWQVF